METNKLTLPIAIIIAGIIIGGAVIYSSKTPSNTAGDKNIATAALANTPKTVNIKPVTLDDHILGDPSAKVLMVEYSDTECPFCKTFAVTMKKLVDTYGKDSTVAWVYRQYPIVSLHPLSPKEAEATECVNKLAGNDVFWKYLQKIYEVTPSNNKLDPAQLPTLAVSFGVDKTAFQSCLDSGTFTAKVQSEVAEATAAGAQGTPFTVLIPKNQFSDVNAKKISDIFASIATQYPAQYNMTADKIGYVTTDKKVVLNGALPYEVVQQVITLITS